MTTSAYVHVFQYDRTWWLIKAPNVPLDQRCSKRIAVRVGKELAERLNLPCFVGDIPATDRIGQRVRVCNYRNESIGDYTVTSEYHTGRHQVIILSGEKPLRLRVDEQDPNTVYNSVYTYRTAWTEVKLRLEAVG